MQQDPRDAGRSLGCSSLAGPAGQRIKYRLSHPSPCCSPGHTAYLHPRAYEADGGKSPKDAQLREISWAGMSQRGEQQGSVVLWMKSISQRWLLSPSLLPWIGIERWSKQNRRRGCTPGCAVCPALLPPLPSATPALPCIAQGAGGGIRAGSSGGAGTLKGESHHISS